MSGMYMSEWPMFGTKDPNLGSSTDLLFDRDFIFGAFATCLIQGGYPVGATFERTGDILRDGVTFAQNESVVQWWKYHHNGKLTNEILWSDDFARWNGNGTVVDPNLIAAPYGSDFVDAVNRSVTGVQFVSRRYSYSYNINSCYEIAAIAKKKDFDYLILRQLADTANGRAWFNISSGVKGSKESGIKDHSIADVGNGFYRCSIIFETGSSIDNNIIDISFSDSDSVVESSGTATGVYIWRARITETAYAIPGIDIPTSGSAALIDTAASQPNPDKHGLNWEDTEEKNAWAFDLIGVTGVGTINLKGLSVVPAVTEWQTTGDFNILSGATGNQILYIESGTGLICATDGTNTTKSVQPYVAGQEHTVSIAFGDSKMQIYLDGVNGTQVPFVGTFTPGETLKWGLNNEDIFSIGNVCGQTTSSFSESVHLAEELAYDL